MVLFVLLVAVLLWAGNSAYGLLQNCRQAQRLDVPILISPIGATNMLWYITQDALIPYIERLPFGLGSWTRYHRRHWIWQFSDRDKIHQEYGPIIAHVTPCEIHVWIADKDVALEILKGKDRGLFDKPREDVKVIDFLGPHLMTACGETWRRHRRIVATPFTHRNNRIVWREALHQGVVLGKYWSSNFPLGVDTVWKDNETVAMNVMVTAGFGLPRESHKALESKREDSFDFHSSLSYMITNLVWMVLIPSRYWFPERVPSFPKSLRDFFRSTLAFKEHLDVMLAAAKATAQSAKGQLSEPSTYTEKLGSDNLLTALVHHSEESKVEDATMPSAQKNSLSDDEIYSNLFGLAFAGHETTAHTLAYSMYLLAAHPEIQNWVIEEVHSVLNGCSDLESLDMDEAYSRLVRTRAIMYETLRVFTPLANVFKKTLPPEGATIQAGERTLWFPPKAYVLPSTYALHSREEYWGKDSLEWKPQRWISVNATGQEEFEQPSPAGSFLPWSEGPRACPGARFSLVEFVGVLTALLSTFRITVSRRVGEDESTAIARVKACLKDSTAVVTLMVKHPEKILVRLERLQRQ